MANLGLLLPGESCIINVFTKMICCLSGLVLTSFFGRNGADSHQMDIAGLKQGTAALPRD